MAIKNQTYLHCPNTDVAIPLLEGLYNLSMEEMLLDVRKDGAFMAGKMGRV